MSTPAMKTSCGLPWWIMLLGCGRVESDGYCVGTGTFCRLQQVDGLLDLLLACGAHAHIECGDRTKGVDESETRIYNVSSSRCGGACPGSQDDGLAPRSPPWTPQKGHRSWQSDRLRGLGGNLARSAAIPGDYGRPRED